MTSPPTSTSTGLPPRLRNGISFDAVDFSYPGASRPALSNFNLRIPAGQTVAIVGPNGAGKSTIIKLLCRFYEPDRGRVLIDGDDIRDPAPADVRRLLSVLFQEPVRYAATVHENVAPVGASDGDRAGDGLVGRSRGRGRGHRRRAASRVRHAARQVVRRWSGTERGRVATDRARPRLAARRADPAARRADKRHGLVGGGRLVRPLPSRRPRDARRSSSRIASRRRCRPTSSTSWSTAASSKADRTKTCWPVADSTPIRGGDRPGIDRSDWLFPISPPIFRHATAGSDRASASQPSPPRPLPQLTCLLLANARPGLLDGEVSSVANTCHSAPAARDT